MAYVRIRNDTEYYRCADGSGPMARVNCPDFADRFPGGKDWDAYPMPVEHNYLPKSGDNYLQIPRKWWDYYWAINTLSGAKAGSRNGGGYIQFNLNSDFPPNYYFSQDTDVLPKVDGITMGSWRGEEPQGYKYQNVHEVLERKNNSTRIRAFNAADDPPDPAIINPQTQPHLFVIGTGIGRQGNSVLMNGVVTYWPLLVESKNGREPAAWIKDEALEFNVPAPTPTEEPDMSDPRPLWRDYSRYQGVVNFDVAKLNGVQGVALRAGISWGYKDMNFPDYWTGAKLAGLYRTSYHVIYTDQPIQTQIDNWYAQHPAIDVIPRVIDLEVDRGDSPAAKATAVLAMSDAVLARDGVRPIIYTRYLLANSWLASWSSTLKNEHYWWLAQYSSDPAKEHPGPPTLPTGVLASSVVLHQTNDKIAGFAGEVESASVDWDRWTLGDETQMHEFIAETWGGTIPEPPPEDTIAKSEVLLSVNKLQSDLDELRGKVA